MYFYINLKILNSPVISKCCKLVHLVAISNMTLLVKFVQPCSCKCVSSGHLLANSIRLFSDNLAPLVMCIRSTLGHAPVFPCPQSCRNTQRIALSPLILSSSIVITLQRDGVQARMSNLLQTCAHILKSTLVRKENTLTTNSSGSLSNELFFGWYFLPL